MSATPLRRRARSRLTQGALPYLLLAPALLVIAAVVLYPMLYSATLSFFKANLLNMDRMTFVGLQNYADVLTDSAFWRSLWVTIQYTVGVVALSFGLGLGTALMLNVRFPLRGLARALIIIPWATPWLVTTLIWYVMFNPQIGPINAILKQLGLIETGVAWLYLNGTAMPVIILVTAWRLFPTTTLLVLAALQSISPELYEAAEVDGAGWLGKLRFITLPGISATSFVSLVLVTISAFKLFTVAWVMTAGGPGDVTRVLSVFVYEEAFRFFRVGPSSTLATLLFILSAGMVVAYFRLLQGGRDEPE
ncbi:MAG TPA: sugar ABC transporter permease [Thermoflexales bacterium]|nr:sugar ABC transporter permease [Anaerolineae bacterium]HQV28482.1 sugar ABC transporter permease [Thermoflexales bacterium]HQX11465.1 sugar ABC transporter permease [Thermoflexales bacterium]HQY24499.1 sugar ABC transporter permease [Thermoflexales bacterium]HQZ54428.1 sugar ABC transporter permease [Thermoflexales bacterium]